MGKKDKDKSKKYNEIRIIVKEDMESQLQNLSINVQLSFNAQTEEEPTTDSLQNAAAEAPEEELSAAVSDDPLQENHNF
ncbi:hypothetical protein V7112_08875 [Bacillus sp. JJ1566]|uniref:hypothetical protein n=1 Tax=Bacillus sp. JJ1566 TaxID=3122961 RepID=UPI002FFED085